MSTIPLEHSINYRKHKKNQNQKKIKKHVHYTWIDSNEPSSDIYIFLKHVHPLFCTIKHIYYWSLMQLFFLLEYEMLLDHKKTKILGLLSCNWKET